MTDQDKERLLAIVVIVVIILGALGYFLWNFALNKGTVIFEGNPPYKITVDDKDYDCQIDPCELVTKEGEHQYKITKQGYNSLTGTIQIARGEELNINVDLTYIPVLSQPQAYTMYKLPEKYSDSLESLNEVSLFKTYDSDYLLKNLPEDFVNIVFSKSGEKALIFEDNDILAYQVDDYTINKIENMGNPINGAFSKDEKSFYIVGFDEASNKDALKHVSFDDGSSENMVYFNRNIDDYDIKISPDEKFAAISDNTSETTILYLIDLERKERTNVYEGEFVQLGKFSDNGNYFVFKGRDDNEDLGNLKYLDTSTKEVQNLPFDSDLDMLDFSQGPVAYFVSDSSFQTRGAFVDFVKEEVQTLTVSDLFAGKNEEAGPLILFKWDPVLNEYFMVANISDFFADQKPSRIEASEDGKDVRFLVGENVYDLVLAE